MEQLLATKLTGSDQDPAYTFGWDTVFAIRVTDVNAELGKPGVCPASFQISIPSFCDAEGAFANWGVATGAAGSSGTQINMQAGIPSGTLTYNGANYDLANSQVVIQVSLAYMGSANTQNLVVNTTSPDADVPAVRVTAFQHPSSLVQAIMEYALGEWFNANLDQMRYIFASVDLDQVLAQQTQWLAPTATAYAYQNGDSDETSVFGVLNMTGNRSPAGLDSQLAATAIPDGARAALLVSSDLFLIKMALPALPPAFPPSTAADFRFDTSASQVTVNHDVLLQPIHHEGSTYNPVLESLQVYLDGNNLVMKSQVAVPISPGITSRTTQNSYLQLKVVAKPDGSQTLTFFNSRPPESNHWTDTSEGVKIAEDILAVIGVIVEIVLAVLTSGASLIISGIIAGLLIGLAAATPDLIASILANEISAQTPSVDALVLGATSTVHWPGAGEFQLTSTALGGSFQMAGDPRFAH